MRDTERDEALRTLTGRLERVEARLAGLSDEVRTRRLAVVDANGAERLVGETTGTTAEWRLDLPRPEHSERTSLLLFAEPGDEAHDLPAGIGIQLWVDGDVANELCVWDATAE